MTEVGGPLAIQRVNALTALEEKAGRDQKENSQGTNSEASGSGSSSKRSRNRRRASRNQKIQDATSEQQPKKAMEHNYAAEGNPVIIHLD